MPRLASSPARATYSKSTGCHEGLSAERSKRLRRRGSYTRSPQEEPSSARGQHSYLAAAQYDFCHTECPTEISPGDYLVASEVFGAL